MRLTVYTDYSLRMLIYLAVKGEAISTIAEVADRYGISQHHLTKVAHQLGLAGFVATVRGKGGGLRLARPAEAIRIGEVVRHTEPDLALVPCFAPADAQPGKPCPIVPDCGLRGVLDEARQAFMAVLDRYSLADLICKRAGLQQLLGLPVTEPGRSDERREQVGLR
jgi:Rrf2 family nitric oxide-sensitive transcriptional repressor